MPRTDLVEYEVGRRKKQKNNSVVDVGSARSVMGRTPGMTVRSFADQEDVELSRKFDRADDAAIEHAPRTFGDTRVRLDAQRATPRPDVGDLGHKLKDRQLPGPDDVRLPISEYETGQRVRAARIASGRLPAVQHAELERLTTGSLEHWNKVNGPLHEATGSVLQVEKTDPAAATTIRRIDRAIQAHERHNDRSHIVHANLAVPARVPGNNLSMERFTREAFPVGRVVTFDQYTQGALNLHEVSTDDDERNGIVAIEMRTRRGAFVGGPGHAGRTDFLLPRGIRAKVVGITRAPYSDPVTKTVKERVVIQLQDLTSERTP